MKNIVKQKARGDIERQMKCCSWNQKSRNLFHEMANANARFCKNIKDREEMCRWFNDLNKNIWRIDVTH